MSKGFDKVCLGIERAKVGLITATLGKLFTLLDHDPEKLTPPLQRVIIHGGDGTSQSFLRDENIYLRYVNQLYLQSRNIFCHVASEKFFYKKRKDKRFETKAFSFSKTIRKSIYAYF